LVGEGPERRALTAAAPAGVHFVGNVDDPRLWYAAADVVVLPSRWEGLALVQLEAMASARCLVATAVGGARPPVAAASTVDDFDTTPPACVPVGDVPALAAALVLRLQDQDLADAEAAAGRVRVCREHDLRRATERVRSVYLDAITGPADPAPVGRIGLGAAR
jgi:glycosyltransferase involved in cell wall biosynthesis